MLKIHKLKNLSLILGCYFIYLPSVKATADGPDFFRSKEGIFKIELYAHPNSKTKPIQIINVPVSGLKNLGCEGGPSFYEWSKLNNKEKKQASKKNWCKISYESTIGWVQSEFLSEDNNALQPSFDCKKTTGEIEQIICQNQSLIMLDNQMKKIFEQALNKASSIDDRPQKAVKKLKTTQKGWIKGRNECWKDNKNMIGCIESNYLERMAYLQAQWVLVSPNKTEHYFCENNHAGFDVMFVPTEPLASVVVEYGDKREVYIAKNRDEQKRFDGAFGAYIELNDNQATFVWNQFEPTLVCPRRN